MGFAIITLDESLRKVLEPFASPIGVRLEARKELKSRGISTYCSVESLLPDKRSNPFEIVDKLKVDVDLFEFGHINPKTDYIPMKYQYNEAYFKNLFPKLIDNCSRIRFITALSVTVQHL